MRIFNSWLKGLGAVLSSPSIPCWVLLGLLVLVLPATASVRSEIDRSLSDGLSADALTQGFDLNWLGEFEFSARGISSSFGPQIIGGLPAVANLEKLLEGELFRTNRTLLLVGLGFLLLWAFFSGGILDRYARPDEVHGQARLFSRSARFFFAMVRLLAFSVLLYWASFHWLIGPLNNWVEEVTHNLSVERTEMYYTFGVYLFTLVLLLLHGLIVDYAKIALVVESRRSVMFALFRSLGFIVTHPIGSLGLALLLGATGLVAVGGYFLVAPGTTQSTPSQVLLAFAAGQAYILARIGVKLWGLAAQTRLFQTLEAPRETLIPVEIPEEEPTAA